MDVVEIVGVIDRPIQEYALERIDAAEEEGAVLLVFQIDSLGGMKITSGGELAPIVERIRDARVPVAVHIGPRDAQAGGVAMQMALAAHVSSIGLSATMGPLIPGDHAHPGAESLDTVLSVATARGRQLGDFDAATTVLGHSDAIAAGWADVGSPGVATMLDQIDGREVRTAAGTVRIELPSDGVDVRFFQPGPIRRLLHTFANPALVYLLLLTGAVLLMFELFQPGFGVAGVTGFVVLAGAIYGLTVLPARGLGLGLVIGGLVLLTLDVAIDGLGIPTALGAIALTFGSFTMFSQAADPVRLSPWLIGFSVASALIMFVPVMTFVSRARKPIAREARARLVGEGGHVRSMLNPEGFVFVDGEIWRARTKDGSRLRVGEDVVVDGIDGAVLIVVGAESTADPTS